MKFHPYILVRSVGLLGAQLFFLLTFSGAQAAAPQPPFHPMNDLTPSGLEAPPELLGSEARAEVPISLEIPSIELKAPVLAADPYVAAIGGSSYTLWDAPDRFAVGWHSDSAHLGEPGNTVLNGHSNILGKVFEDLGEVSLGDWIYLDGEKQRFAYRVTRRVIFSEKYEPMEVRIENARWILPTAGERLTLITCWPPGDNTHRLVLVAEPAGQERGSSRR